MPELACLELALLNLLRQLDSTNSDRRVVESFESEHRPNPLFHPTVILFDEIVQVLARSHSHSAAVRVTVMASGSTMVRWARLPHRVTSTPQKALPPMTHSNDYRPCAPRPSLT